MIFPFHQTHTTLSLKVSLNLNLNFNFNFNRQHPVLVRRVLFQTSSRSVQSRAETGHITPLPLSQILDPLQKVLRLFLVECALVLEPSTIPRYARNLFTVKVGHCSKQASQFTRARH